MSELSRYRVTRTRNKQKYLRKRRRRVAVWTAAVLLIIAALLSVSFDYWPGYRNLPFFKKSQAGPSFKQPKDRVTALIIGVKDTQSARRRIPYVGHVRPTGKESGRHLASENPMVEIPGIGAGELSKPIQRANEP